MPQIRVEKNGNYTTVTNAVLQNPDLSLKAKGLLLYMLSLPVDWDYSIGGLASKCKEGTTAIRSAIHELMAAGHISRRQAQDENGQWAGYEYTVFETPHPSCENTTTESTAPENRTQQNKNLTKEELNKIPPISPQGEPGAEKPKKEREKKTVPYNADWFEAFWARYPRKVGKQQARKAWDKLRPDKATCCLMRDALERDKSSRQWTKDYGEFIPHPATWLNQRRWEDEGVDLAQLPARPLAVPADYGGYWADDPEVIA